MRSATQNRKDARMLLWGERIMDHLRKKGKVEMLENARIVFLLFANGAICASVFHGSKFWRRYTSAPRYSRCFASGQQM